MNLALWIVAGLLALAYLPGGIAKMAMSKERFAVTAPNSGWTESFSARSIKLLGALEALAAVGVVLPAAVDIAPSLVPLAATGMVLLMTGAASVRISRHDPPKAIAGDLVYLALAAFVAWGRFGIEPFTG